MPNVGGLVLSAVVLLAGTSGAAKSAPAARLSDAAIEAQCRPFFHDACSEAMGHWLPGFELALGPSRGSTRVARRDDFRYEPNASPGFLGFPEEPSDGTLFVFGIAGPPRGHAVYDYAHRIAFYDVGCCSWHAEAETADALPPPKRLVRHDLLALSTERGVRLWQTEAEVVKIYGKASFSLEARRPDIRILSYAAEVPFGLSPCYQTQTFFFRAHRLIEILLTDAC